MYVITGGTGHTGSRIAKHLVRQGKPVRLIGRSQERLQQVQGVEPFLADLTDAEALTRALTGAQAVYAMIPPNETSPDYPAEQKRISDALAAAVARARVTHVVTLSSVGADKPSGTGPVAGLHDLEQKLNIIPGLNTLHLRPGYFMENLLEQAAVIRMSGIVMGPLRGDLKIPMIATRDIAAAAADELLRLDFSGHNTRELLGPRDYNMNEAALIIGAAINKPELTYMQVGDEQLRPAMMHMGLSNSIVDLILEMSAALNSGHMAALEPHSIHNTTPTKLETFVAEEFVPLYKAQQTAA